MEDLLSNFIEIRLKSRDDFLKIAETLTRIGICSERTKSLFQTCHILHKMGKYYIVHFKQMFMLDSKQTDFSESDLNRTKTISNLLAKWGLYELVDPKKSDYPTCNLENIRIVSFSDKRNWTLSSKYSIGKRKF